MDLTMYFKEAKHETRIESAKDLVESFQSINASPKVIKRELTRKYSDLSPEELKDIFNEYQLN
ncbi:hypothetical protein EJK17_10850 [Lactobacillus xujianguonis]|uniref:Uncharacterized protein n=2 Tax=Lactobacillus xujianguonis TaxID=2495899 RepID=A0A437SSD5_9LACO|nr:hypothetical protein [Lactobacillus xujianguonis]RVU69849.1 hypothetical protein EJK17_10850 [Lactobacillus xujianguonis]